MTLILEYSLMIVKFLFQTIIILISYSTFAAEKIELHNKSINSLSKFEIININEPIKSFKVLLNIDKVNHKNQLLQTTVTKFTNTNIKRYQQLYMGIPVIGGQVTTNNNIINGEIFSSINIVTSPQISKQTLISRTKLMKLGGKKISNIRIELQIRFNDKNEPKLVYQLSFNKSLQNSMRPSQPVLIIDANTGELIKHWNNLKYYDSVGPGGNLKSEKYWYGLNGLPSLNVKKNDQICTMENNKVKLVNLIYQWDWYDSFMTAHSYYCLNGNEDQINGAFSPINDAYYFGGLVVDMYRNWYSLNALQYSNGESMKLVMRVHFGEHYDNAFWDGQAMSFGDGNELYPLVSLDLAGHEVSHGFTQQHSDLEYHDKSGAINESFSDMAGIASRAYLLENNPQLHKNIYLGETKIGWDIGKTITKDNSSMRYMKQPSLDGSSADCLNKDIANAYGSNCIISYQDIIEFAKNRIDDEDEQQSFIVHTASGIFNKAFYLIAKDIGIKPAFNLMIQANSKYWLPTSNFQSAACGVLLVSRDLHQDQILIKNSFLAVGIELKDCPLN